MHGNFKVEDLKQEGVTLDHPTLRGLAYLLRHEELWPKDFEWCFWSCRSCAMGLAAQTWEGEDTNAANSARMAKWFGMDYTIANHMFCSGIYSPVPCSKNPTPEYMASLIDAYLMEHPESD